MYLAVKYCCEVDTEHKEVHKHYDMESSFEFLKPDLCVDLKMNK